MNYVQIVEICCRDLRRYLVYALSSTRGGVVSVKMSRLLQAELQVSDYMRYLACLNRILRQWRWKRMYVIPRRDAEELLKTFDAACEKAKRRREPSQPRSPLGEKTVPIVVALPSDLVDALDAYARLHGVSRSAVVRRAIQELVDMHNALEELDRARNAPLVQVSLRLPADLLDAINQRAATLKAPRSALVRYAVAQMLRRIQEEATQTAP